MTVSTDEERAALEAISKILTGSSIRLPVAGWVRTRPADRPFFQREVSDGVGAERQYMKRELDVLCALGLIDSLARDNGEIRQYYTINADHPGWLIVDAALQAAKLSATGEPGVDLQLAE